MSVPPKFTPAKVDNTKKSTASPSSTKGKTTDGKSSTKKTSSKEGRGSKKSTGGSKGTSSDSVTKDTTASATTQLSSSSSDTDKDKIISEKDKEIETLKNKIKKYEAELRRSDDTILVQEEEIKRLNKKISDLSSGNGDPTAASSDKDGESTEDTPSEGKGSRSKGTGKKPSQRDIKKKTSISKDSRDIHTSSGGSGSARKSSSKEKEEYYPLPHFNLREGTMKDAFADLSLNIVAGSAGGPSGTVSAHAYIASVRCPKFDKALKDRYGTGKDKKKKIPKKKSLDLRGSDTTTINRLLDYLYSDECYNIAKLKPIDLLNLIIAARRYSLDRLVWMIENEVLRVLSLDNVVTFLKAANELKDDRIRKFCMDFLLLPDSFKDFVLRKDLTTDLGMELFTELVTLNATQAAQGPKQMEKLGDCPTAKIRDDFKDLYTNMLYADACVNLQGETIQFHKAILAAGSKHIYENFNKAKVTSGQLEDVSECLELTKEQRFYEKVSPDAFRSLLRFLYYGETDIEALPACLLIPFAKFYGMNELQELCEKKIQQNISNSKVVLKIMAVTYLAIMAAREDMRDRLRKECIAHCMTHLKDINLAEIRNYESEYALHLALDLLLACQKTFAK